MVYWSKVAIWYRSFREGTAKLRWAHPHPLFFERIRF